MARDSRYLYKKKQSHAWTFYFFIPLLVGALTIALFYVKSSFLAHAISLALGGGVLYAFYVLLRDRGLMFQVHEREPPFRLGDMSWEIELEEFSKEEAVEKIFKDEASYERVFRLIDSNFVYDVEVESEEEGREAVKSGKVVLYRRGIEDEVKRAGRRFGRMLRSLDLIEEEEVPLYAYVFSFVVLLFISRYYGGLPSGLVNAHLSFSPLKYFLSAFTLEGRYYLPKGEDRRRANDMLFVWNLLVRDMGYGKELERKLFLPKIE